MKVSGFLPGQLRYVSETKPATPPSHMISLEDAWQQRLMSPVEKFLG